VAGRGYAGIVAERESADRRPAAGSARSTVPYPQPVPLVPVAVRRFAVEIVEPAPALPRAARWESAGDACTIGSSPANDVVLDDPTVSGWHCEIRVDADGARVRDLGSTNGTTVDGVRVSEAFLRDDSTLRLGAAAVRFRLGAETNRLPLSEATRFGALVGRSAAMRATFALCERAAASDVTVLLDGETGTGKGAAAEAIHEAGARRDGPFVVVDCGVLPRSLVESELFGHERGAFTGAEARRIGAFEDASGGTIFLDEIAELPPELQPKLLRALENRQIRRVGSNAYVPVDVRVIAASNRDLRAEVNAGRFRADLYFRLAVLRVPMPALRSRPEDIPEVVEELLRAAGVGAERAAPLCADEFLAGLQRSAWPGNVRELRNFLERCLVLDAALAVDGAGTGTGAGAGAGAAGATSAATVDASVPYPAARQQALAAFERGYVDDLLRRHGGNVSQAARAAGIARVYLYRLMRRHGAG